MIAKRCCLFLLERSHFSSRLDLVTFSTKFKEKFYKGLEMRPPDVHKWVITHCPDCITQWYRTIWNCNMIMSKIQDLFAMCTYVNYTHIELSFSSSRHEFLSVQHFLTFLVCFHICQCLYVFLNQHLHLARSCFPAWNSQSKCFIYPNFNPRCLLCHIPLVSNVFNATKGLKFTFIFIFLWGSYMNRIANNKIII